MAKKRKGNFKKGLSKQVLALFKENPKSTFNYKQISKGFGFRDFSTQKLVTVVLRELEQEGFLVEVYRGKYKLKTDTALIEGIVDMTSRGAAYIVCKDSSQDIYISSKNTNNALHGDKVKVNLFHQLKNKLEGEIVEVVERAKTTFVGVIQTSKKFAFFIPDNNKIPVDFYISNDNLGSAKNGDKVIVELTHWPIDATSPFGKVIRVLGRPGENETEMHAILAEYGLPYEFPKEVEQYANSLDLTISKKEIAKRKDFRAVTTFTIDPKDAKDFDDALSIQKLENGNWEIGVHIADVTHYLEEGSILDQEAYQRATSVYLVDRVVPMLPEILSNGACSLRPKEEKYTFSAVFEMDEKANVINQWFGKTVTYSDYRFTYEEAQQLIEGGGGLFKNEILQLNDLAQKLRAKRFKSGSFDFDRVEVKFEIAEDGTPTGVFFKESKEANKLIEEFMLLANKKVAEFIGKTTHNKKPKTFVYRVHDEPDPEKVENFSAFVKKLGYNLNTTQKELAFSMNNVIKEAKGSNEEGVISQLAIRTMAKAIYSINNVGHYGLGFPYYTHFTSPIRRYPDVMVHRLLFRYLNGKGSVNPDKYDEKCKHSSKMELLATEAERASIKYKQVEFLHDKIGQVFTGRVSGISEWGLYVELIENLCEGMIRLKTIKDDFYYFDEENHCAVGKKTGKTYQIGDLVVARIIKADLIKKQLDFELVENE